MARISTQETISFRIERARKNDLDDLAKALDRDRSYLLNQAVGDFLEAHRWEIERIRAGLAAAEAGDYASDDEMTAARAAWRDGPRKR